MLSHWNWNKAIINKMNVTFSIIRGYVRISVKVLSSYSCFLPRHFARFNNFRDWQMFRDRPVTLIKKVVQRCSVEKLFWEISQNPQENTCVRVSFLIRLQALGFRPATLLKKRLWYRCFPVNVAKFLRTAFFRLPPGGCYRSYNPQ